jgi:uncharacterized protein YuzE
MLALLNCIMKITYDSRYNIAYIHFKEAVELVQTIEVSGEMNIDIAPDGTIYGIELLNANALLHLPQITLNSQPLT